jgi:hypothetical protein
MGALNNAFSNALNSIGYNLGGIVSGKNPLTQPQIGELLGFNIPGVPLISTRDYFLTQLESWLTTIPLQSQWIILIQPFPSCINTNILQGLEYTGGENKNFNIDNAKNALASYPFQKVNGCIFAQSVSIPQEQLAIRRLGVSNQGGFLPGVLNNGRSTYSNTLNIDFLETNTSFSDFVIRPWVIAAEHFGFVARQYDTATTRDVRNVKSTVYVLEYSRTYQHVSMIPKKVWTFFNCAPISVEGYNLTYDEPNSAPKIKTQWTFTNYAVSNALHLPLPNIIDKISSIFKGRRPIPVTPAEKLFKKKKK